MIFGTLSRKSTSKNGKIYLMSISGYYVNQPSDIIYLIFFDILFHIDLTPAQGAAVA